MGHFAKLGGFVGLAALLAATAPASAGFRHGGYFHSHGRFSGHCHNGQCFNGGYAPRYGGLGYDGLGYPAGFIPEAPIVEPQPYPVDYGAASYEPTGYGVVYNVPPTPPMWRRPGPRIVYIHDGWRHRRHHHHFCARRHGMAMVRGGHISME